MSATIKWLDSDSEVELSSNTIEQELVLIGSGAQGAVYKWDSGKGPMALKVLSDTNIFDRVSEISKRIASGPDSLKKRGVPVAYGVGQSSDFGLTSSSHVVILVFNYINGVYLHEAVEDEGPASDLRKMLTKKMLYAFGYLETSGVIHTDAYEDNFFVDQTELYFSDLEGAGIWDIQRNTWKYKPLVAGKTMIFPAPIELNEDRQPHLRTMSWYGLRLAHKLLLGFEPYDFFVSYKASFMKSKWLDCLEAQENETWPPNFSNPEDCNISLDKLRIIDDLYNLYVPSSQQCGHAFRYYMLKTFGKGYIHPEIRPSIKEFSNYVWGCF